MAPVGRFISLGRFTPGHWATRPVIAYVPGGPEKPRPLLVLLDGQNVFADEGSFAGGWYAHEAVEKLGKRTFERPVVVAVPNGGRRRGDELGMHAPRFVHTLVEDLLPAVRAQLPVTTVAIGGASLGGLTALQAWLTWPGVFTDAMVMSPSLWFNARRVHRAILQGELHVPATGRLYVDAGKRERGTMFSDAARLSAFLTAQGLGEDRLMWRPDAQGAHNEVAWRRRLPKALRFLFRRAGR